MFSGDIDEKDDDCPVAKKQKLVVVVGNIQNSKSETVTKSVEMAANGAAAANGSSLPLINGSTLHGQDNNASQLDQNLYSRQIYAIGESAMLYLRNSSVLISGIGGVGVEIAKNLILGGVRRVTIHDTKVTTWIDLSAQYYLHETDIDKNRAVASFESLSELNDSVTVQCITSPLTEDIIRTFDLTIITDSTLDEQLLVNKWTRANHKLMLVADIRGLFGTIFVDFGDEFRIDDANGEKCSEFFIEHVDKETGDVLTLESIYHGLEDGDYVTFAEVKGMTQLNQIEPLRITVKTSSVFNIGAAAKGFADYTGGGRVKQVKMPKIVKFKSLQDALLDPNYVISDFAKFDRPAQIHALWLALHKFIEREHRSPKPRSHIDYERFKGDITPGIEIDEHLIKAFSYQATGNLSPMASFIGGVAAQEAMKAITHHMTPINQFLYFDALEALPGDYSSFNEAMLTEELCAPQKSRYDGQAAVFGWPFQNALIEQKWFIVGAGAIGCELLKNFAMMGVGAGKNGKISITDMDQIEISNLNRQFLFRRENVGGKKSEVAAKAVMKFNHNFNIQSYSERVCADSEHLFNDDFFESLNGVANALDNIDARQYMDRRCVYYHLPLLESGTMGSKGNTQVVYPEMTESYSSSVDPPEKSIPICTLKNFPNEIQHTIQWARDLFEGIFTNPTETVNQYLDNPRAFLERIEKMSSGQQMEMFDTIKRGLIDENPKSPEACIIWARKLWQQHYHESIAQLLHNFPPDQVSNGVRFWSGTKRCPHALNFDVKQEEHFNFVYAASILRAQQYNLTPIVDKETVASIAAAVNIPKFEPRSGVKIAVTDAEAKEQNEHQDSANEDVEQQINSHKIALGKLKLQTIRQLTPIDFEKDDDTNHHMEFITAASNLRAENYDIPRADMMTTKQIAGRIIPAIATTTSAVAGLIMIELYKMIEVSGIAKTPIERFKSGFINLALPFFGFSEPIRAPVKKYNDREFTLWTGLDVKGPLTLQALLDWLKKDHGLDVSMLSCGVSLLYSFFMPADRRNARLQLPIRQLVETVTQRRLPAHTRALVLEVMATDDTKEDVETPYIKYILEDPMPQK